MGLQRNSARLRLVVEAVELERELAEDRGPFLPQRRITHEPVEGIHRAFPGEPLAHQAEAVAKYHADNPDLRARLEQAQAGW